MSLARARGLAGAALAGYVLGGLPSADVAARLGTSEPVDLRTAGSGNPGAVNALAVLGPRWGYAVMAADIAKGAAACRLGRRLAECVDGNQRDECGNKALHAGEISSPVFSYIATFK